MRKAFIYISIAFAISMIAAGCGFLAGNDPLGITGGGENGYGSLTPWWGHSHYYESLSGNWRHNQGDGGYEMLSFDQDGMVRVRIYNSSGNLQFSQEGNCSISGEEIHFDIAGWNPLPGTFSVDKTSLKLTRGTETTVYQKMQ
jgi:hypothetical protein